MDTKTTNFQGIDVILTRTVPLDQLTPELCYTGFNPHEEVLPKGAQLRPDRLALPCDIHFSQDVGVKMRDGATIYADILRPNYEGKFPAIVAWSPYGKNGSGFEAKLDIDGVDMKTLSGLQKFEACDPAYWCDHGYVIVNVDSRGAYMSEGDVQMWGTQDAKDGYDMVEWIAQQPWSNGKVAFSGNSWLAATQWGIAAQQPPHLTAIAPWEGITDLFGDDMCRGGIPDPGFNSMVVSRTPGNNYIQDTPAMVRKYPYRNAFWDDKVPDFSKINVPAYIVASYNSPAHTNGTIEAFGKIASKEKWLRIHNTGEWPDFYEPDHKEDLRKFFDYYLKGVMNDWLKTPKVRMSLVDPGGTDIVDQPEQDYPLARRQPMTLHLTKEGTLSADAQRETGVFQYDTSDNKAKLKFQYVFPEETVISGFSALRLFVEVDGAEDMDVYVSYEKYSADGRPLMQAGIGKYTGPNGRLRASCRTLDPAVSTEEHPILTLRKEDWKLLKPGEIVQLDIPIWPTGLVFHPGEKLVLSIAPTYVNPMFASAAPKEDSLDAKFYGVPEGGGMPGMPDGFHGGPGGPGMPDGFPGGPGGPGAPDGPSGFDSAGAPPMSLPEQHGIHKFHVGGDYDAFLLIPTI